MRCLSTDCWLLTVYLLYPPPSGFLKRNRNNSHLCSLLRSPCGRTIHSCARATWASSSLLAKGLGRQPKTHKLLKVFSRVSFLRPKNGSRYMFLLNSNAPPGRNSRGWFHGKSITGCRFYQTTFRFYVRSSWRALRKLNELYTGLSSSYTFCPVTTGNTVRDIIVLFLSAT